MDMAVKKFPIIIFLIFSMVASVSNAEDFRARLHQKKIATHSQSDVYAEVEFGRRVAAQVLGRENLLSDPELIKYVTLVGQSLVLHSPRQELLFHFGILNSDSVNAYSTPGGYVFITKAALALAEDEAELAAILAHEIAHINSRHIVRELNIHGTESDQLSVFTRMISASSDATRVAANQALNSAMTLLFDQGYKITDELEADQQAMLLLASTGYDPSALPRFLQRVDEYLALNPAKRTPTHPSSQHRFHQISVFLEEERLMAKKQLTLKRRFSHYVSKE
jgi:predicted Zn-dependent protease